MASDYIAKPITQLDSGACRKTNCWAAVGAYLVDSGTRGRKRPTPAQFRKAAGVHTCRAGGLGDVITGCARYGVKVRLRSDLSRQEMRWRFSRNKAEKVYAVAFDFDAWPDDKKCIPYDGYHMVAVIPGKNRRKSIRTMDPLCRRIRWVRRGHIINAALEYNDEHDGQTPNTADVLEVKVPKE